MAQRRGSSRVRRTTVKSGPVQVRRVDPQAWAVAKALAGGDHRRLHMLRDDSIVVENDPHWRKHMRHT